MQIEVMPQIELGSVQRIRVGDASNTAITVDNCQRFRFKAGALESETQAREPGPDVRSRRVRRIPTDLENLFPPLRVPVAPPAGKVTPSPELPP
jgi:hypothetical protein